MRRPAEKRPREPEDHPDDSEDHQPPAKKGPSPKNRAGSDQQLEPDMKEYTDQMEVLEAELQKDKPKSKRLRKAMNDTFAGRRQWIQDSCPPVSDILAKFSLLKKSKYVSMVIMHSLKFTFVATCVYISFDVTCWQFLITRSSTMPKNNWMN